MPQAPVTNNSEYINLGPMEVFVGSAKESLVAAESATDYRKLGQTRSGVVINHEFAQLVIKSGFPLRTVKKFITETRLEVTGELIEFSGSNFARVIGGPEVGLTLVNSPAPTLATGSTKTVLELSSAAGFSRGDEIAVVGGSVTQYGVIRSISNNSVTLFEGLSLDETPAPGDTVKLVDKRSIPIGSMSSPVDVSLKLSKTLEKGKLDIYVYKANAGGTFSLNFGDGEGNIEPIGLAFAYEALADSAVDAGNLARAVFQPNA